MTTHVISAINSSGTDQSDSRAIQPAVVAAHQHGYASEKGAYLRRLKRIEGQVRGIARMIDEDKYCIDILTQVAAVNSAMHALSLGLLESHLTHCVADAARQATGVPGATSTTDTEMIDAKIREATQAIGRLLR